ncbi:IS1634 family transposase [Saccharopolyspora phatthalungensis]|uniref:Transposase n=1 Tax=Saccharopolyspora phatthalungensis TaxID=664693 RepID=A0A840QD22_9PSEU|nr:IS1634 family transposase [Saccharopolyspora phatthalungensis]MBB5156528.1 transposase [Saccharopolyspora phatthalungensis]
MRERRRRQPIAYGGPSVEKMLGALPVVAEFCRRLDLAGIIDRACPVRRDVAILTHGQVIEALVANRLTSPAPLLRVTDWARSWSVEEVLGIDPAALNDDRIGRALDAIAPELDRIVGSVGAQAITGFGLDVSRCHWDMTSISLYGAYEHADPGYAAPRFGHPKDRRPDLKQIQAGLAVTGDGGVPVLHRSYDGGAGEVAQVVGAMTALKDLAGPREFLLVGDSKLVSYDNLHAMISAGVTFIAPAAKTYVGSAELAALDPPTAAVVDYVAERDANTPADQRGTWRVVEDAITVPGKRKKDSVLRLRRVFVHSSARAGAAATARARKLDRATGDLDRLIRGLGSRHYPTEQAVTDRITAIARDRRVKAYLRSEAGTDPVTGKPTLTWWFDKDALDAEAATDGWYALLTNLPADVTAAEVLIRYKGQEVVERRYSAFKGPLAVAPMFLKTNRRITALITVICLALLIFCLIERAVRTAIAPQVKMPGLYPGQQAKPTGRLIFQALAGMRLIPAGAGQPAIIPQPTPAQARLLDLLAVDPTQPP